MRHNGHKLKLEVQTGYKEKFHLRTFLQYSRSVQRSCAVSILGNFQDLTGQSSEQPEDAGPVLRQEVQCLPTQTIQDSVPRLEMMMP